MTDKVKLILARHEIDPESREAQAVIAAYHAGLAATAGGELLTTEEVAVLYKVSKRTLARWRREGCGPRHIEWSPGIYRYPARSLVEHQEAARSHGGGE